MRKTRVIDHGNNPYGLFPEFLDRYKESVSAINSDFKKLTHKEKASLIYSILNHCEQARAYHWTEDQRRQQDRDALNEANTAANAALRIAQFAERYPHQFDKALSTAEENSGIGMHTKSGEYISCSLAFSKILREISKEIADHNLWAKSGGFLYRYQFGPIVFKNPIDDWAGKREKSICLAVFIASLFRWHSIRGSTAFQIGEPVPLGGKPRWKIVHLLVSETLGAVESELKRSATKLISDNPDLRIFGYLGN